MSATSSSSELPKTTKAGTTTTTTPSEFVETTKVSSSRSDHHDDDEDEDTNAAAIDKNNNNNEEDDLYVMSTITLLEHVNLNIPNQAQYAIPFYYGILGCGVDPRKAMNMGNDHIVGAKKTIWANCGASQFHLPHDITPQRIPGKIGVRMDNTKWQDFEQRVDKEYISGDSNTDCCCIQNVQKGYDTYNTPYIQLTDQYSNIFYCRPVTTQQTTSRINHSPMWNYRQPILVRPTVTAAQEQQEQKTSKEEYDDIVVAQQWGRSSNTDTDCVGIDFVEFHCPPNTATQIAQFYKTIFGCATVSVIDSISNDDDDATTTTTTTTTTNCVIIGIGMVDTTTGQADQTLIFRETPQDTIIPPYDGHHIALYVGSTLDDFDRVYIQCEKYGIVWCNPRFADQATTLELARNVYQQFRFLNIIDIETKQPIFQLEHEIRSIHHEAWPGGSRRCHDAERQ